jgi:GH24 family phage-related lysozyme (muramidase)
MQEEDEDLNEVVSNGIRIGEPQISDKALSLILNYEVGGGESYYNKFLYRPTWPGLNSGVTIGIGYDLGYTNLQSFKAAWTTKISPSNIIRLARTLSVRGRSAKELIPGIKDIKIPWQHALSVFKSNTIPIYTNQTNKAFPGADRLHPDAYGALVSLVFNRGSDLTGSRRIEMARIRSLVPSKDYKSIAFEIRKMKRLWKNAGVDGLLKRREDEAKLVESCI